MIDLEEVNRSQAWCWARECRLDDTSNKEESTKKVAQYSELQSWRKATSCLGRRKRKPRSRHWTATSSKGEHLLSRRGKQNEKTSDWWSRRGQVWLQVCSREDRSISEQNVEARERDKCQVNKLTYQSMGEGVGQWMYSSTLTDMMCCASTALLVSEWESQAYRLAYSHYQQYYDSWVSRQHTQCMSG